MNGLSESFRIPGRASGGSHERRTIKAASMFMISKKSMTFEIPEKSPKTFACRITESVGYGTGFFR